jgi:hypothetical protein
MALGRAACTAANAMARRWAAVTAACWTAWISSAVIGSTMVASVLRGAEIMTREGTRLTHWLDALQDSKNPGPSACSLLAAILSCDIA